MARKKPGRSRPHSTSPKSRHAGRGLSRPQIVWTTLMGAMTVVGGTLFALGGGRGPRMDGLALPAMVSTTAPSSVEAVFNTRASLQRERWKSIVIHHSGSPVGSPATLEQQAIANNLKGLGYHFVIGNGNGIDDGEVHVGFRWLDQLPGAHAAGDQGDWYNRNSIGICLIGDGNRQEFTPTQIRRLLQLVDALAREFRIPRDQIILHSDIAGISDPGRFFPAAAFNEQLGGLP